jgi:plastocyanin
VLAVARAASAGGGGGEVVIELYSASFFPQSVQVSVEGSVTWIWRAGDHRIASGSGPEDPSAGALFDAVVDAAHPGFTFTIERQFPEGIRFFDRLHPGLQGFIGVDSGEIAHRVGVVDNVFIPDELYVFSGDTVRWEHEPMEMFHTVTSGTGAADPQAGALFDAPSSDDFPAFEYQFVSPGVQPYFCRPHEDLGMVGTVFIQRFFLRGDASDDGVVDISDAVAALNFLFLGAPQESCDDALDANDDGAVDIGDPIYTLNYLFLGAREIPDPYPRPGQDRTADEITCMP